jgi:glyoxylate reductase
VPHRILVDRITHVIGLQYPLAVRIVSTSSLPIDLTAQVNAQFPDAVVEVPKSWESWVGLERCDLSNADALVCLLLDKIDESVIARAPKLRVIANCAVGYDNVDVGAATRAGIAVTNTPDVLTDATAEFTVALIFAAARLLHDGELLVRGGQWPGWRLDQLLGQPIKGRTLGVLGMGRIGQAVAQRMHALGMNIIYNNPEEVATHYPSRRVDVEGLFRESDVLTLHCPLTPETNHIVNYHRLTLMKPTAIVVNTARGACVSERHLAGALENGVIFAAALDVFRDEPRVDPLALKAPRLILAPHLGSATTEARTQMAQLCADAVLAVLAGKRPTNLVNKDVVLRG